MGSLEGPYVGELPLSEIQIDESMWGEGATDTIYRWLLDNYDREKMPRLSCATIKGREGIWLLGWANEGTSYPSLLETIFGAGYSVHRLDQMKAQTYNRYGVGKKWQPGKESDA